MLPATAEPVRRCALELRYQVYCIERGFLPADGYPDGIETDAYDAEAAHFYVDDINGDLAGYARLLRGEDLPFLKHCRIYREPPLPPIHESAEVSRLVVRKDLRGRRVPLMLFRQIYQHCLVVGINHLYCAMERPLWGMLDRYGVRFGQIGPRAEYYGPVIPYLAGLRQLERRLEAANPALFAWFQSLR